MRKSSGVKLQAVTSANSSYYELLPAHTLMPNLDANAMNDPSSHE
jgi:hypothetical protein